MREAAALRDLLLAGMARLVTLTGPGGVGKTRLTVPVLLTHGLDDQVVLPAMSEHNAQLIPHAKLCWYGQVGHSPFLEVPDRVNADLWAFASGV